MKTSIFLQFHSLLLVISVPPVLGQDYEVADISCTFSRSESSEERLYARLRKPVGFRGDPLFADSRRVDPSLDPSCQIHADPMDPEHLIYNLLITDFARCGVLKRNGFVNVRLWFPRLPGVVTLSDQEVIIMCQPTRSTVVQERASAFLGTVPSRARISGIVEESPARLEYTVGLFQEALPSSSAASRSEEAGVFTLPVTEPVPIGTRLQLKATINSKSVWRYSKLLELTVSADRSDPYAPGHVVLVQDSCRNPELSSIVLTQPMQDSKSPHEVHVTMETFLLGRADGQVDSAQLWLHTKMLACAERPDCKPEFCLDLHQPSGFGRRRRAARSVLFDRRPARMRGNLTSFGDNVGVRVVIPEEFYVTTNRMQSSCSSLTVLVAILGSFLVICCALMCFLAVRLHRSMANRRLDTLDDMLYRHMRQSGMERDRVRKLHHQNLNNPDYTQAVTASATSSEY